MAAALAAWPTSRARSANALGTDGAAPIVAARLVRQDGGEVSGVRNLEVPLSGAMVGRKDSCSLRLDCPTISGEQFWIWWNSQSSQFEIEDRSSNGTFLNEKLIGRGRKTGIVEGDMVRLTKRKEAGLVYRFEVVRGSSEHAPGTDVRSVCKPSSGELAQVPPPLAEVLEIEERHLLAGLRRRISQEEQLASSLAAEITRARKDLTGCTSTPSVGSRVEVSSRHLGTMPSRDGMRAAEEEALQEAERSRLISQRTVLEAELVEKQAAHEQSDLQLRRVQAALQQEREERTRLQEELRCAIEGYAGVSGDIEAFQEHLVDLARIRCGHVSTIEQVKALEVGLQAKLQQALAEQSRARAIEHASTRKSDKLEVALSKVSEIATALATDMRSQAHHLSAKITASSPHLVNYPDSLPPTAVAGPREVENDEKNAESPLAAQRVSPSWSSNSPAPTTQAANAIDGLKAELVGRLTLSDDTVQRSPLLEANGKENISPRIRGRHRVGGLEAPCVAIDSEALSLRELSPPRRAAPGVLFQSGSGSKRKRQVSNAEIVSISRSRLLTSNIEDLCSPERQL